MTLRLVVLTAALLLSPLAAGEEGTDVGARVKAFRAAMKSRDPAARIEAVGEVEKVRHENVAKALARHLGDQDPKVRAAVARALGGQGAGKYVKQLLARLERWEKDDPVAVIGTLDGLALLPDQNAVGDLAGVVRKILSGVRFQDQPVGIAAAAALGKIRAKKSADQLIRLLDPTRPLGPAKGYVSEEVRIFRTSFRAAIFSALTDMTGRHIKVTDVWQSWWKKAGGDFEFPSEPADPNAGMTYEDPAYGFVLSKPDKSWTFSWMDWEHGIIKLIHTVGPRTSVTDVEVLLEAYATSEYSIRTPAQAAAFMDEWAATQGFRKNAGGRPMIRTGPETVAARIAGQSGRLWRATGTTTRGKDVTCRKYFFLRDGLLYTLTIETTTGLAEKIRAELEEALGSLRFTG